MRQPGEAPLQPTAFILRHGVEAFAQDCAETIRHGGSVIVLAVEWDHIADEVRRLRIKAGEG